MTKLKQMQQANKTRNEKIAALIKKYQRFIENIKWHISTNEPGAPEVDELNKKISYYQDFITDLLSI